ncbi:hypothetical protein [Vibrio lentus]|uniref:hypothetical protein n=1 Tax=Vibrio lentus TaxID=136468 RepID=UPI000C86091C|nr:hypothetical protein [Vibrio lentus]PMM19508.1 hypothetical protein BCT58_19830 [Vibrio lentus]
MSFLFHWAMVSLPFPFVLVAMRKYLNEEIAEEDAPSSVDVGWMVLHIVALLLSMVFDGWGVYLSLVLVVAIGYLVLTGIAKLMGVTGKTRGSSASTESYGLSQIELHKEYDMTYRDSKGKISERSIILRGIEHKNGEEYLQATCLLRRRSRTFKKSNIITLTDTDTGEVVI